MKPFSRLPAAHLRPADFTRFAANDLPKRKASKLRRHLSACAQCQAEWQATRTIWQAARDEQAHLLAAPPSDLRERIFAALPSARFERKPSMLAFLFDRPVAFASLAAAATAFVGVSALTYGPAVVLHAPRAVAFEDVEAAMNGIKNATWMETITISTSVSTKLHAQQMQSQNCLQVNPPRIATREIKSPPGEMRLKNTVYFGNYAMSYAANGLNYSRYDTQIRGGMRFDNANEMVRRALVFPRNELTSPAAPQTDRSPFTKKIVAIIEHGPWVSTPDTLNGKTVVRLQSRTTNRYPISAYRKKATERIEENTVWADPVTYRIVRRETHTLPIYPDGPDIKIVCDNYEYNTALPPNTFDVPVPPVGTPYLFHNWTQDTATRWAVTTDETTRIRATLEKAARLWNTKQAVKLEQNWDFGFNGVWAEMSGGERLTSAQIAEEKRHWQARVEKGIPYKSWRLRDLTIAKQTNSGIYVREKASEPFPPAGRPLNYSATCDVMAVLQPGAKPVPCSMTATFHRVGNDFRITYLNMYNREMGVGNGIVWRRK